MDENRESTVLDAEARFLEAKADELIRRAKDLHDTARRIAREEKTSHIDLEGQLERLKWTPALSGKCDYSREAPAELVEVVRSSRDGVRGTAHHFTASKTEPTLFRFKRNANQ
ncbi:MAG TPA: hypothetical protein VGR56_02715 [Nitrososphaerales archaeon]|nr:hypothetical protein [Nitrososphaerales archaeon]